MEEHYAEVVRSGRATFHCASCGFLSPTEAWGYGSGKATGMGDAAAAFAITAASGAARAAGEASAKLARCPQCGRRNAAAVTRFALITIFSLLPALALLAAAVWMLAVNEKDSGRLNTLLFLIAATVAMIFALVARWRRRIWSGSKWVHFTQSPTQNDNDP